MLLWAFVGLLVSSSVAGATHEVSLPGPQIFSTALGLEDGSVVGLDVDSEGRTVVVSTTRNRRAMRISRLTIDGSFDNSFGIEGHVDVDLTGPLSGIYGAFFPSTLVIDRQDRVVLVGSTTARAAVVRFGVDGLLDASFGQDGFASFDFDGRSPSFADAAVGRDGTLIAVGLIDHTAGFTNMVVAKLGDDGKIDESFGNGGIVSIDIDRTGGWDDAATAVALRRDGRIVVAGNKAWVAGGVDTAVVQLLADGSFDEDFGENGIVRALRSGDEFLLNRDPDVAIGRDAKIVLTAERLRGSVGGGTVLVRLLDNGSLDPGFGDAGVVLARPAPTQGTLRLTSDGRILLQGRDSTTRFDVDGSVNTEPRAAMLTRLRGARLHWDRNGWLTTVSDAVRRWEFPTPVPGAGFWLIDGAGSAYDFGEAAPVVGPGAASAVPVVGAAPSAGGDGYLLLTANGAVIAEGDAVHRGDAVDIALNAGETWVGVATTPRIQGYWLFSSLGRVSTFGDATQAGDLLGFDLDEPIVSGASTPDGSGYFLFGRDGGAFAFGNARFSGSVPAMLGGRERLDAPIVAIALSPSGNGYWMVASDGGVFAFGDARFMGSIPGVLPPGTEISGPIVDIAAQPGGYSLFGSDGGVFAFGSFPYVGSLGGTSQIGPIVAAVELREPTPLPVTPALEVQGIAVCNELDRSAIVAQEVLDDMFVVADQIRPLLVDDGLVRSVEPSETYGAVEVELRTVDNETAAEVRRRAGSFRLCLSGPEHRPVQVQVQPGLRMADRVNWLDAGEILVATQQSELDALVVASGSGFDISSVDLSREVVVAIGLPISPSCPPIVSGIEGELSPRITFEIDLPDYPYCGLPGVPSTSIFRVDRGLLATGDVVFVHPVSEAEVEARIEPLEPQQLLGNAPEPIVADRGVLGLPALGQTMPANLADGTPVFVVRHDDGAVSVIDPRAPASVGDAGETLALWATRSRRFVGYGIVGSSGVWDEYGQSLDVGPRNDLARHVVELTADGMVRVGQPSNRRLTQDPITGKIATRGERLVRATPTDGDNGRIDEVQTTMSFVDLDMSRDEDGLWLTSSDGSVEARGTARYLGDRPSLGPAEVVVALVGAPDDDGYWLFSNLGRAYAYGAAPELGDVGNLVLGGAIVDATAAPSGIGYYLLGSDGGVFAFGSAPYLGSVPELVPGSFSAEATAIAAADGSYVISTGEAGLFVFGSAGASLPVLFLDAAASTEVVDVELSPTAGGYRVLGADGGVFSYGSRLFLGSVAGAAASDTVAIVSRDDGSGYLVLDRGGSVWAFGNARSVGVQRFGGVGTTIIDVDIVDPAIIHAVGDSDDFRVSALDFEGVTFDDGSWNARGTRGFSLLDAGGIETLVVNTVGSWTLEILPVTYARIWRPSEGGLSGVDNEVIRLVESPGGDLEFNGNPDLGVLVGSVASDDRYRLERVSAVGVELRGLVPPWPGASLLALVTGKDWSIDTASTQSRVWRATLSAPCRDLGRAALGVDLVPGDFVGIPDWVTVESARVAPWPGWARSTTSFDGSSLAVTLRGVDCTDAAGAPAASLNIALSSGGFMLVELTVRPAPLFAATCRAVDAGGTAVVGRMSLAGFEGFEAGVTPSNVAAVGVSGWVEGAVSVDAAGLIDFEFADGTGRPCPPEGFIVGKVSGDLSNGDRFVAYVVS